ncbi:MAG: hypothetical protein JWL83_3828 [Actinomycetia bacterium]|jgi:hypothetical protein|nr:hypothetical protein [Actinomycetes bacterium]
MRMSVTEMPSGLGKVCGAIIRARTFSQGVFDVVIGEKGLVLVPLSSAFANPAAAAVVGVVQGGVVGHIRGGPTDARRRASYFTSTADALARLYFSNRTVRRSDVVRVQVWDGHGSGKLRLELNDGAHFTFRWERRANREVDVAALLTQSLGSAVDVRRSAEAA